MRSKKGFKYYGFVFIFATLALGVYVLYLTIKEGSFDIDMAFSLITVPIIFTILLFVFDKVFDFIFAKIFKSKGKGKNNENDTEYKTYLTTVGKAIDGNCEFSIEDYRRLRANQGFQKSLEQVYRVYKDGESEEISFGYLEKKYKKNSNEFIALSVVISEVKQMIENS
jgi:hypothetical protein